MDPTVDALGIDTMIIDIIGLALLLACSGFFSGSETALTAASRARMQALMGQGNKA
ncbi:MAG: CNNM domain-containing protein, partial [Dongia sp.]